MTEDASPETRRTQVRHTLVVDRLWDGAPIPPEEQLVLTLRAEGEQLVLEVDAPFHGDPPPPGPPGPTERLWEHEVVELFVAEALPEASSSAPRYTEIELGPHGHHLVLQLEGVRQPKAQGLPLSFYAVIGSSTRRWRGMAKIERSLLPPPPHRVNAYAIHGQGETRRYLAWAPVPGAAPDFHRLECFRELTLP